MRLMICIWMLIVGAPFVKCSQTARAAQRAGALAMAAKKPVPAKAATDTVTVFLTGHELGVLKPCGCTGGQLGGFERRAAILDSVPASKRIIVDTGSFVYDQTAQDLIKFDIIVEALQILDYDLVSLTESDLEIAASRGLFDAGQSVLNTITYHTSNDANMPAKCTKELLLNGKPVAVTVAAFDTESRPSEEITELFGRKSTDRAVNILIVNNGDPDVIDSIARTEIVDCLICPAGGDEAIQLSEPNERPLVLSVGRYGRHVGKLQIKAGAATDQLSLDFSSVDVTGDLPPQQDLVMLYKDYQQMVKDANLLEQYPKSVLPEDLKFTGSDACKMCHKEIYEKLSTQKHAHAYATLVEVGSQYDPECISCHVVGFEYETGFISEKKSGDHLRNVGCENCHGPGSIHIGSRGKKKTQEPKSDCYQCHTYDHSGAFAANEKDYFKKIMHWTEPKPPSDVKN